MSRAQNNRVIWSPYEDEVLQHLPAGRARVAGSAVMTHGGHNDLDVFVEDHDDATFSRLLLAAASSKMQRIHPVRIPSGYLENLQNHMSWQNCALIGNQDGTIVEGDDYVPTGGLVFNPASKPVFPSSRSALKAADKLVQRGYHLSSAEKARCELHLEGHTQCLATIARHSLGHTVTSSLIKHGAIVAGGFLRDEIDAKRAKDIDIFVPSSGDWAGLCEELSCTLGEVVFNAPPGKRVNLRKFKAASHVHGHEDLILDVIDYGFVHEKKHVVETFDFQHNMLWWDPASGGVEGSLTHSAGDILHLIRTRKLIVGDNLWYRSSHTRSIRRWARFRAEGYVADELNIAKYSDYVHVLQEREHAHIRRALRKEPR